MVTALVRILAVLLILTLLSPSVSAQSDPPTITVMDYSETLAELIDQPPYAWHNVTLSPDLTQVAWVAREKGLCVVTIATRDTSCRALPDAAMFGLSNALVWSASQQYIALTVVKSNELRTQDVWLYDVSAAAFSNITQNTPEFEHYYGYQVWAGPDTFILAEHEQIRQGETWSSAARLFRLDPVEQTLSPLIELGDNPFDYYDLRAAVAPDGARLALTTQRRVGENPADVSRTLSLLDLTMLTLSEVAPVEALSVGLPQGYTDEFIVANLVWSPDGTALIVELEGAGVPFVAIWTMATRVELDPLRITPVLDLSAMTEADWAGWQNLPKEGAVSPDGRYFFYEYWAEDGIEIRAMPTTPGQHDHSVVTGDYKSQCGRNYPLFTVQDGDHIMRYPLIFSIGCAE